MTDAKQPAADFDAWQQNPYTKVLMKSIAEDYGRKEAQQPAAVDGAEIQLALHVERALGWRDGERDEELDELLLAALRALEGQQQGGPQE